MEGGWGIPRGRFFFQAGTFSSRLELFLPGWNFFFQAGTFCSRWEVFLPAGYFGFRLGVISFIPKFWWFRD